LPGIYSGAVDMSESDIAELIGYLLSCFAAGFVAGYLLRVFRRGAESIR
jgi:hypothetical protein